MKGVFCFPISARSFLISTSIISIVILRILSLILSETSLEVPVGPCVNSSTVKTSWTGVKSTQNLLPAVGPLFMSVEQLEQP